MKNLIKLTLILCSITIISCQQQDGYVIKGTLTGFPDSTMIYLRNLNTDEIFDSTLLITSQFELKGHLQDVPEQIWFNTRVGNDFIYTNLLIGNDRINIEGDIKDFPWNVSITGSRTQDDSNYLRDLTKSFSIKRDSLVQSYLKLTPEGKKEKSREIWGEIRILDDTTRQIRVEYVKSHINTYPGVINLGYLKNVLPKDTVKLLYNELSEELKASKYARVIEVYLNEKISEIGDTFHDFEAYDQNEEIVSFSDLIGKYILLDFTSAYCGPCIQAAEELRWIAKTYSDSIDIISFSVDPMKDTWLKALDRDSVSWTSLWDGKGRYSETVIKYGVIGYPTFFVIDKKGKIIDKWSGYGKGLLENKLEGFQNN